MSEAKRKLSKSACEKYMQCPASFDYHYNQKIRPVRSGSPLIFGGGMDEALNALLKGDGKDPLSAYKDAVAKTPLGIMVPSVDDYDSELLSDEDKASLLIDLRPFGYTGDDVDGLATTLLERLTLFEKRKSDADLSENQRKAIDLLARKSLERKAALMIDAYSRQVLPYIEKVHNIQKESGPGYLDATVEWHRRGKLILDNKTSSKRYPDNAVEFSAQLAMYAAEEKINQVAYVVLLKPIKKNREKVCKSCGHKGTGRHKSCDAVVKGSAESSEARCGGEWTETILPEAEVQIVHGEISPRAMEVAAELQREVARAVEAKIFPCNVQQCNSQFGKPCIYRDLKWKNDMTGLTKVEGKKR